jgi:hypothetical protein
LPREEDMLVTRHIIFLCRLLASIAALGKPGTATLRAWRKP